MTRRIGKNKFEKCSKLHQGWDDLLKWTIKMSDAHAVQATAALDHNSAAS